MNEKILKMEREEEILLDEMRALINRSCQFDRLPTEDFSDFHKIFLKFSFNAVQVRINYEAQDIHISNCKPLTTDPVRLFNMKEAVADKFSYTNLEETLAGCLKSGQLQHHFYEKLLLSYGNNSSINSAS